MRDPGLHIKRSDLVDVILALFGDRINPARGMGAEEFADAILVKAKKYTHVNRSITTTSDRVEKKMNKLIKSDRGDAALFARVLHMTRIRLKHRGIRQIEPNSRDWPMVKEVTGLAIEFGNEFNLDKKTAFRVYIDTSFLFMKKFSLPKLNGLYERISEYFGAKEELLDDDDSVRTKLLYNYYQKQTARKKRKKKKSSSQARSRR